MAGAVRWTLALAMSQSQSLDTYEIPTLLFGALTRLQHAICLVIELAPDAAERFPYKPRAVVTRLHEDGSVVDQ